MLGYTSVTSARSRILNVSKTNQIAFSLSRTASGSSGGKSPKPLNPTATASSSDVDPTMQRVKDESKASTSGTVIPGTASQASIGHLINLDFNRDTSVKSSMAPIPRIKMPAPFHSPPPSKPGSGYIKRPAVLLNNDSCESLTADGTQQMSSEAKVRPLEDSASAEKVHTQVEKPFPKVTEVDAPEAEAVEPKAHLHHTKTESGDCITRVTPKST